MLEPTEIAHLDDSALARVFLLQLRERFVERDEVHAPASSGGARLVQRDLSRGASSGVGLSWSGVVTVVESLSDPATSGFRLRSVELVTHAGAGVSGTDTSATSWSNLGQVMLMGGFNGAGCTTAETEAVDHKVCHVRLFPSGTNTINWVRNNGGANSLIFEVG